MPKSLCAKGDRRSRAGRRCAARGRRWEGHPLAGDTIHHSDAGSQGILQCLCWTLHTMTCISRPKPVDNPRTPLPNRPLLRHQFQAPPGMIGSSKGWVCLVRCGLWLCHRRCRAAGPLGRCEGTGRIRERRAARRSALDGQSRPSRSSMRGEALRAGRCRWARSRSVERKSRRAAAAVLRRACGRAGTARIWRRSTLDPRLVSAR